MKEIWKKYSMWDKIAIYVLGAMLVVMILGLILIGTVSIKNSITNESHNGFWLLNNTVNWTIGNFIQGSKTITFGGISNTVKLSDAIGTGSAAQLQTGLIFTVILTPILLFTSIGIFGYSFYLKKSKKTV